MIEIFEGNYTALYNVMMKNLRLAASAAIVLSLAACGGPPAFVKPGATEADIAAQQYDCRMQAKVANPGDGFVVGMDRGFDFRSCMDAHGFADISTQRGQAKAASWGR